MAQNVYNTTCSLNGKKKQFQREEKCQKIKQQLNLWKTFAQ